MATINYTIEPLRDKAGAVMAGGFIVEWKGFTGNTDVGQWYKAGNYPIKSIHVWGTLGTTPTWNIQGSNEAGTADPVDPALLADPNGNDLTGSTEKIETVQENTVWIRPTLSATGGGTNLNVSMLVQSEARR
jgi:hypothetical protein